MTTDFSSVNSDSSKRTIRHPDMGMAKEGGVRQEGSLPIYSCTCCGEQVVWATSRRTGRKYLVNVRRNRVDARFYMKNDLHKCKG